MKSSQRTITQFMKSTRKRARENGWKDVKILITTAVGLSKTQAKWCEQRIEKLGATPIKLPSLNEGISSWPEVSKCFVVLAENTRGVPDDEFVRFVYEALKERFTQVPSLEDIIFVKKSFLNSDGMDEIPRHRVNLTRKVQDVEDLSKVSLFGNSMRKMAFGTLALGVTYPDPSKRPSRDEAIQMIKMAYELGIRIYDCADTYSAKPGDKGEVEKYFANAKLPADAIIITKMGMERVSQESWGWRAGKQTPKAIRQRALEARDRLNLQQIPVFMLHHSDGLSPEQFNESLLALQALKEDGVVKNIGLSNCSVAQLERCKRIGIEISIVENQFSLYYPAGARSRASIRGKNNGWSSKINVIEYCADEGIIYLAYGIFGGLKSRDGRLKLQKDFPFLSDIAKRLACSPHNALVALIQRQWPNHVIPLIGARTLSNVECSFRPENDSLPAKITEEELEAFRRAMKV